MAKRKAEPDPKDSSGKLGVRSESETARFVRVAEMMKRENTKSPEAARAALMELGILESDGRLSDNYK